MTANPCLLLLCLLCLLGWGTPATAAETPAASPLRVLVVRGLWHAEYRIEEALAAMGGGLYEDCWVWDGCGSGWPGPGDQGAGGVSGFPDATRLARYHAVIVANVNAKAFGTAQKALIDYVRNGGGVFFLGGRFAFGKAYRDAELAAICPVEFPGARHWGSDLVPAAAGSEIKPGPDRIGGGFTALPWPQKPLVFWYHEVKPKPDAKLLLTTQEGKPLLVTGTSGKGRVALFAGTVMGDPAAGQVPFWQWAGWPALEAALLNWLTDPRHAAPAPGLTDATRQALAADAGKADDLDETPAAGSGTDLNAVLRRAAAECRAGEDLKVILQAVRDSSADLSLAVADALAAHWRLADASFAPTAEALVKSGQPYKTALGARLLGVTQVAGAETLLATLAAKGLPAGAPKDELVGEGGDGGEGGGKLVLPAEQTQRQVAIQLGALAGLGHLGDARALPALKDAVKRHAAGAPKPKDYSDVLTDENRLYQQAVVSALCCGDDGAAPLVVAAIMEDIYTLCRARMEANKPKDRLAKVHGTVGAQYAWRQQLNAQLPRAPVSVLPAMAKRLAAEPDRRVAEIALALFAGRVAPAADLAGILKAAPVPVVRALADPPR